MPRFKEFLNSFHPEATFFAHAADTIHSTRPQPPEDGDCFRPLMLGYVGARNTGADIRVAEMLRQLNVIYLDFQPTVMTIASGADQELFDGFRLQAMDHYFPDWLRGAAPGHNAIMACEGSMLTSTFSDVLSAIFATGMGYAARRGIPGIAYGADAGRMRPELASFARQHCEHASIFARSASTRDRLQELGLASHAGTDTAWSFDLAEDKAAALREDLPLPKDGPYAVICPVNPYWWPVRADPAQAQRLSYDPTLHDLHYRTVFFHSWSPEKAGFYERYLGEMAALAVQIRQQGFAPLLLCMEPLDKRTATRINQRLTQPLPILSSEHLSMRHMLATLAGAGLIVSSRYHACLLAIAQQVPVVGITYDSRIPDLFEESGLSDYVLPCDTPDLAKKAARLTDKAHLARTELQDKYARITASQLRALGEMGRGLARATPWARQAYRPAEASWSSWLPPLSSRLTALLNRYS